MNKKKQIRNAFREAVFERDNYQCVMCGKRDCKLDAHHIEDRHNLSNGGYVLENSITLCAGIDQNNCHWKAEQYHSTGLAYPGFSPDDLFEKIGSSLEIAKAASNENYKSNGVADERL